MLLYPKLNVYQFTVNMFSQPAKDILYDYITGIHKQQLLTDPKYKNEYYTFYLPRGVLELNTLYNLFVDKSEELFGNLTLSDNNHTHCSMHVSNLSLGQLRHNHTKTCVINALYYFSIPDKNTGQLIFYDGDEEIVHQPVEDTLLIFPNYLDHSVLPSNTERYRIAFNMEIFCEEDVWNVK